MKLKISFILLSLTLINCSFEENKQLNFPKVISLDGNIFFDSVNLYDLELVENNLVATSLDYGSLFTVFDIKDQKYIGKIKNQKYFDSFTGPPIINQIDREADKYWMWIHDLNKDSLFKIDFKESLGQGNLIIDDKLPLLLESRFHTVFYIDSTLLIGRSTNTTPQMNRLQLYNPSIKEVIVSVDLIPTIKRKSNDINFILNKYNNLYTSALAINRDKTVVVSAMCAFDRIDYFDTSGKIYKSIYNGKQVPDSIKYYLNSDSNDFLKMYYTDICSTEKFLFALYYGQTFQEYTFKRKNPEIRIFTWDGAPVARVLINYPISILTVDENSWILYGYDDLNKLIITFQLNEIINEI